MSRCFGDGDPLYERYHDEEWGRPVTDERGLFERMSLEAFQSGLSWLTILRKRDAFRAAFDGFDIERVARYGEADAEDDGEIRDQDRVVDEVRVKPDLSQRGPPIGGPLPDYATSAAARPAASRSAAALSVRSHVKSWSSRPKWPYAAVFW